MTSGKTFWLLEVIESKIYYISDVEKEGRERTG